MKNKVLLLNPPSENRYIRDYYCEFSSKADYYWPPQDLLVLSGILRQDYEIEAMDCIAGGIGEEACLEKIAGLDPAALIFTTGMVSLGRDLDLIEKIKRNKRIIVIGSGSLFRFIGEEIMEKRAFLDALITDFTCRGVSDYLKGVDREFAGMIYRKGGKVCAPKPDEGGSFSAGIPLHELFSSRANRIPVFGSRRFAAVTGSAGCTFNCKFCVAGTIKLKKRPLEEIFAELRYISGMGIRNVFFVDPLFTAEKERVFEFCRGIKDNGIMIKWACNGHAATLQDAAMLEAMKQAGCRALLIGAESANDDILRRYNKGASVEQVRRAFLLCRKAGIKTLAYFIIGLPGEDEASVRRTIAFAKEIDCDYASFGCATADIGTELRRESLREGWPVGSGGNERFDSSSGPALGTGVLSADNAGRLLRRAYREFYLRPGYIMKKLCETRSAADIGFLLRGGFSLLKKNCS